ncbi:splicing factor 3a subunit 3 [Piptocephalis cylindrospora]|uniref:Splicing factor 3a subunit 3 n=1 Tax=Piptocephalis cylindrospora TaxID=1907219 RepID=A0A4P9Y764_9FUNG|nr:splicing factor 3a subunit 3 [Piptocephalis cylindrospora]|eukprot:RKP14554.1 splicing factor 3a subunit 3 [Piptocephalis cylindrospora]
MQSLLEDQRRAHEELECIEDAIVAEFATEPRTYGDRLFHDHRIKSLLDRAARRADRASQTYADLAGTLEAEISTIRGSPGPEDAFTEFYSRLREVKERHRQHPGQVPEYVGADLVMNEDRRLHLLQEIRSQFSGEEANGRFLDMHTLHDQMMNLHGVKKVDYLHYLDAFDRLDTISASEKGESYAKYVKGVREYLESFLQRTQPLLDTQEIQEEVEASFTDRWAAGTVPGWEKVCEELSHQDTSSSDPSLYCTPCKKQFAKQTVFDSHVASKKHKRVVNAIAAEGGQEAKKKIFKAKAEAETDKLKKRDIALNEALVQRYAQVLTPQREATKANVERKQVLTEAERQAEIAEMEAADAAIFPERRAGGDSDAIYNPLKLPLGWDGKPIPYWLYRLHGLSVDYTCEICGGHSYQGRKAFEKHFQEHRHSNGLRCLGITNSRTYHDITSIEDAKTMQEKLRRQKRSEGQMDDAAEEFEDAAGNVFSRKTYQDLKRQGLL